MSFAILASRHAINFATHVEFALVLVGHAKSQALVEPHGRIDLEDPESHGATCAVGLSDEAFHHFRTDAPPLNGRLDEQLCKKERFIFYSGLHPADIGALDRDDLNLGQLPLAKKACNLRRTVKLHLPNDVFHASEIEAGAIVEVLYTCRTERDHRLTPRPRIFRPQA